MDQIAATLHKLPELSLFLSILLGHIIGRFHFKGVGFGTVVGTLIAGILVGILAKPELPDLLRWAFFYLFLFSIGYSIGPQFFGSLRRETLPQVALAVIISVTGLATVIGMSVLFDFDEGIAVGLLSGGMTQSAALGTGLSAISELPISAELKTTLSANAPLADAITYGFGDLGLILFLTAIGPWLMKADLKKEARALEQKMSGGEAKTAVFSDVLFAFRAYHVERLAGITVGELEERYATGRLAVQRNDYAHHLGPEVSARHERGGNVEGVGEEVIRRGVAARGARHRDARGHGAPQRLGHNVQAPRLKRHAQRLAEGALGPAARQSAIHDGLEAGVHGGRGARARVRIERLDAQCRVLVDAARWEQEGAAEQGGLG